MDLRKKIRLRLGLGFVYVSYDKLNKFRCQLVQSYTYRARAYDVETR